MCFVKFYFDRVILHCNRQFNTQKINEHVFEIIECSVVTIVLPLPNPDDPKQHEACCPLCKTQQKHFSFPPRSITRGNFSTPTPHQYECKRTCRHSAVIVKIRFFTCQIPPQTSIPSAM